jgi:hypothetical protein
MILVIKNKKNIIKMNKTKKTHSSPI